MTFLFCSAFFNSYVRWRRIHISGEITNSREIFRQITAERGLRSAKMSWSIRGSAYR